MSHDSEKRAAARHAALLCSDGMRVGLGTGTTVDHLLPALAERNLSITCVATSPATEKAARALGLDVQAFDGLGRLDHLDVTIDGADQVAPNGWLVKGGGGAHTREKIVAAASDRFLVIVSPDKLVEKLSVPVPLELLEFGLTAVMARLGDARIREGWPRTPDGGVIADYFGPITSVPALAADLDGRPGVVGHGLFPPGMVDRIIVGDIDGGARELLIR